MGKELETINVGIVGHIDHGKTTLLHKLTGVWASRHSEELKRGITIKLGYADTVIYNDNGSYNIEKKGEPVRHISFVDAPGHEMLMATMLSGAAMIDAAVLVVAANEGIKPQTREHLMALQAKGIRNLIVVQNKIDLVDKEQAKKSYEEIKKFLGEAYGDVPIIPISAQQGVNVDVLLRYLAEIKIRDRDLEGDPVFVIARSFDINRPGAIPEDLHGTVLGGSLIRGVLKVGDKIEIKPGKAMKEANQIVYKTLQGEVRKLFKGSREVNELTPGGSMSVETSLDMSFGKSDSLSGNVMSLEGKLPEISREIKFKFKLFPEVFGLGGHISVEPIKTGEVLMLSINTSTTGGSVVKVSGDEAVISLRVPVVSFEGDNLGIARNIGGHWRLIGFGNVV